MEREGENLVNVFNLLTVFEDSRASHKQQAKERPSSKSCSASSRVGQLTPFSPGLLGVKTKDPSSEKEQHMSKKPQALMEPFFDMTPGLWESESLEDKWKPGHRPVSTRLLNSLKNKISSGGWKKPCEVTVNTKKQLEEPEENKIVRELLETEQTYVSRLHLLDQVFFEELLKEARSSKAFSEDVVKLIFSNISSIHQFHSQFFLPELQRRVKEWAAVPRIGDVIQKLAPFLKMYSEYVKNFERAAELLAIWTEKCPPFQEVITRIQNSEVSANLTLQHHMLEPVQRIPRYELLLKEYVEKLPPDAADQADAQKALDMIFSAAQHSNAAISEMERLQNLWDVYQRLGLEDDIVDPSNELLQEGPIQKISFRHSSTMERYLFLFNNMLLYCVPKVIQVGAQFQVRTRIDVAGMKVRELNDVEFPHSFLVSGKQRTLELQAQSQEEMNTWIQACQQAIDQIGKRHETFKAAVQGPEGDTEEHQLKSEELGIRAPQWVRDKMVTMCMRCKTPFNALTRRRHHCRACGYVVCAKCSDYRARLKYDDNRLNRVCLECYVFLTGNLLPEDKEDKKKGILEKESSKVSEQSLMCSFLQLLGDKWGKSSSRGWCVIPRDDPLVLYIYAAPQDMKAHTSIPLLGYQVTSGPLTDPRAFQLQQSGLVYSFRAESEELRGQWMKAIDRAARGQSFIEPEGELSD
ncbi:FYVE, RhoGEF and PH domain-containing protein 2 [Sarcophilus harrisii]|uniref:FYVE, RhoGEF and PH domain containing 2 n=1 Tax=Sarcophilus harrisii TaxID=9305 RepID=G3WN23_SARHA|nr:FYVE, RhoGEF and PH domain-containing protein 2 [Sarcophilus harrisii]